MIGKAVTIAVLGIFLTTSPSWGFRGGAGLGISVPSQLLMPSPPRDVKATAGNGMATIEFAPPKTDGGNPVLYYTVKSRPGGIKVNGKKSPVVVNGLTNGKKYTFTVTATNSVGTGLASEPSNCITPGE